MVKIKYQIRSEVKGKLVPIYLYYQDSNNHFRIKTEFKVKQECWNPSKEIIKPVYFDENNFSIEQRNSLEQSLNDLKSKVESEITLRTAKGLIITREYVSSIFADTTRYITISSSNLYLLREYLNFHQFFEFSVGLFLAFR